MPVSVTTESIHAFAAVASLTETRKRHRMSPSAPGSEPDRALGSGRAPTATTPSAIAQRERLACDRASGPTTADAGAASAAGSYGAYDAEGSGGSIVVCSRSSVMVTPLYRLSAGPRAPRGQRVCRL